jgi:hypothetical protein
MISASGQLGAQPRTRLAYSRSELATLLGVSTKSVQRLEARGLLKSSKAFRKKIYSWASSCLRLHHTAALCAHEQTQVMLPGFGACGSLMATLRSRSVLFSLRK